MSPGRSNLSSITKGAEHADRDPQTELTSKNMLRRPEQEIRLTFRQERWWGMQSTFLVLVPPSRVSVSLIFSTRRRCPG